jgi:hydroxylamine reductase (hybrid-cluster protein)
VSSVFLTLVTPGQTSADMSRECFCGNFAQVLLRQRTLVESVIGPLVVQVLCVIHPFILI